jgi:hypothetical protein
MELLSLAYLLCGVKGGVRGWNMQRRFYITMLTIANNQITEDEDSREKVMGKGIASREQETYFRIQTVAVAKSIELQDPVQI